MHTIQALRAMLTATALVLAPMASVAPATAVAPQCDRACLVRTINMHLAALERHDASGVPLDRDARFIENAKSGGDE